MNPYNTTIGGYFYQYLYQPKTLVKEIKPQQGYRFVEPSENNPLIFGLNFLNTDLGGKVDVNCMQSAAYPFSVVSQNSYTNFISFSYSLDVVGSGANVTPAQVSEFITCMLPSPKPFMGVNSVKDAEIKLYPNPATDRLYISGLPNVGDTEIVLYDLVGRKIIVHKGSFENNQLSVSSLENGIYLIQIFSEGEVIYQEEVIKE